MAVTLLTESGEAAFKNYFEVNKGRFTRSNDAILLQELGVLLETPGFKMNEEKPITNDQMLCKMRNLASAVVRVPLEEMLREGLRDYKTKPQIKNKIEHGETVVHDQSRRAPKKRKRRSSRGSETAKGRKPFKSTTPAISIVSSIKSSSDESSDQSDIAETQSKLDPVVNSSSNTSTKKRPSDSIIPDPYMETHRMVAEDTCFVEKVNRTWRQIEKMWGRSVAPTSADAIGRMKTMTRQTQQVLEMTIRALDIQQLQFMRLSQEVSDISRLLIKTGSCHATEHGLRCLYSRCQGTPTQFLQAFTGAAICHWIFDDFDKHSNLPDFSRLESISGLTGGTVEIGWLQQLPNKPPEQFYRAISTQLVDRLHNMLMGMKSPTRCDNALDYTQAVNLLIQSHSDMCDVFTKAFLFRHDLARSSGQYEYRFVQTGAMLDKSWMDRISDGSSVEGAPDLVQLCFAPAIFGSDGSGEDPQALTHALVL